MQFFTNGSNRNIESITAFCDWDGQGDVFKINDIQEEFNRTFTGYNDTVTYLSCDKVKTAITTTFAEKTLKSSLRMRMS